MGKVLLAVLAYQLVCAGLGYAIGRPKLRAVMGAVLGYLLGAIGVLIIAVMKPNRSSPPSPSWG